MLKRILNSMILLLCLMTLEQAWAISDPNDYEGSQDPDLLSRMQGIKFHANAAHP